MIPGHGLAFYTPPSPLPAGAPGAVIWTRPLTGSHVLPNAASNTLVLYHSTRVRDGADIAESAMVAIPKGAPPKAGFPLIAFAHGDVGVADPCVVSADNGSGYPSHDTTAVYDQAANDWVKRGYVVVRPDYEGLGTPGLHPEGVGESMARSVIDSVRAARNLDPRIGNRFVAVGHSRGGQAVLFTANEAAIRARELQLIGTVAMAPVSGTAGRLRTWAADPNALLIDANFGIELYGAAVAYPDVKPTEILTPTGHALYAQIDKACQSDIFPKWALKRSGDILRAHADLQPLFAAFDKNETDNLDLGAAPILIAQGLTDGGIFPTMTEALVRALKSNGASDVTYRTYAGQDHMGVVPAAQSDVEHWIATRFAKHPANTSG